MFFPQNMFFISNSNLFTHETELNGTIPALFQYIVLLLKVINPNLCNLCTRDRIKWNNPCIISIHSFIVETDFSCCT